jgi:hypothetical protein
MAVANALQPTGGRAPIFGALSLILSFTGAVIIVLQFMWVRWYRTELSPMLLFFTSTYSAAIGGITFAIAARFRKERYWGIPWAALFVGSIVLLFLIALTYMEFFTEGI